jgi:hypothetical protein
VPYTLTRWHRVRQDKRTFHLSREDLFADPQREIHLTVELDRDHALEVRHVHIRSDELGREAADRIDVAAILSRQNPAMERRHRLYRAAQAPDDGDEVASGKPPTDGNRVEVQAKSLRCDTNPLEPARREPRRAARGEIIHDCFRLCE